MKTLTLKADEIGQSEWYVHFENGKWLVCCNIDTVSNDFETGETLSGMRSHVDSEYSIEAEAFKRMDELNKD